jgi:hypothetical protein
MGGNNSKQEDPWKALDRIEGKLDNFEKAHGYYVSPNDSRIASGVEAGRIAAKHAKQDQAKAQTNYNALKARLDQLKAMSIPKRRIVKKKKSRKTRSQHAKKVSKSRKTRSDKSAKRGPCKAM